MTTGPTLDHRPEAPIESLGARVWEQLRNPHTLAASLWGLGGYAVGIFVGTLL